VARVKQVAFFGLFALLSVSTIVQVEGCRVGSHSTIGAKLRSDERRAAALRYPAGQQPLTAIPLWKENTYYSQGNVVINQGNPYVVWNYPGGISSSGSGPSGTGPGPISDGTVTWYYDDQPVASATSQLAPVITDLKTPPAGLSQFYSVTAQSSDFWFSGGIPSPLPSYPSVVDILPFSDGTMSFETDAPHFAIKSYGDHPYQIVVDGRNVFAGGRKGVYGGYINIDFSNAARKKRDVTLLISGNVTFEGVYVDPASTVTATTQVNTRVCVFGDSITSGGNGFPLVSEDFWPRRVGQMLGWSDVWNLAEGGTGYINKSPTPGNTNFLGHVGDATNNACELVLFFGGLNDGYYPDSQLHTAALKTFQEVRAGLPNAPIIVFGVYASSTGPSATVIADENAIHSAVTQFNDPLTWFVPVSTDPAGPWVYGTGFVVNPTGDGNADSCTSPDGTHPTEACIIGIIAPHIARAVSQVIQQIP
jgi:hypothetical protein